MKAPTVFLCFVLLGCSSGRQSDASLAQLSASYSVNQDGVITVSLENAHLSESVFLNVPESVSAQLTGNELIRIDRALLQTSGPVQHVDDLGRLIFYRLTPASGLRGSRSSSVSANYVWTNNPQDAGGQELVVNVTVIVGRRDASTSTVTIQAMPRENGAAIGN